MRMLDPRGLMLHRPNPKSRRRGVDVRGLAACFLSLWGGRPRLAPRHGPGPADNLRPADAQVNLMAPEHPAGYDTTCIRCHAGVVSSFAANPHASLSAAHGGADVTCAGCHGPGKAHVQSGGDQFKIFDPSTVPARQVDDNCLTCHAGKHSVFERSAHGQSNEGCTGCHSIHSAGEPKYLLKAPQPQLCFQCHEHERSQFSMPSRHRVAEGLILCIVCHEPHGTVGGRLQRSSSQEDIICTKCHTEIAGPFVYEHAVVKTEGCTACHVPHGGPNPHVLNRAKIDTICLLCHFPSRNSSSGAPVKVAHDLETQLQSCTACHTDIHGSDASAAFLIKK
jgi:DmsE family decaheme c-type cytochrome